jgi:hypothetical protein
VSGFVKVRGAECHNRLACCQPLAWCLRACVVLARLRGGCVLLARMSWLRACVLVASCLLVCGRACMWSCLYVVLRARRTCSYGTLDRMARASCLRLACSYVFSVGCVLGVACVLGLVLCLLLFIIKLGKKN